MHRRKRDVVRQPGGNRTIVDVRHILCHGGDVLLQQVARIGDAAQVTLHVGLEDALHVVTHTDVENHAGPPAGKPQLAMQRVNQHPCPHILVKRLVHLQFLRPLAVVTLVLHVDAGLGDLDLVQSLDGLQLDEPGATQPRRDDILRHLGMRTGRNAKRRLQVLPIQAGANRIVRLRMKEQLARNAKNRPCPLQFREDPRCKLLHRDRLESIRHVPSSPAGNDNEASPVPATAFSPSGLRRDTRRAGIVPTSSDPVNPVPAIV